ncbi:TerD family protein [Clostridium sp. D2Q-11]|uniref:TerD family protein n=1 Tax=Anaeromonas frigoriresistens TaxID=2683708 RepID=A0A942UPR1_9FIRM|nr:TerD family protein [Anaeromonas frigoriresistens]
MAINLSKGQRISLTKDNEGLSKIKVGLGWDPIEQPRKKGLLGAIMGSSTTDMDCDASVFMLGENDKMISGQDRLIYFGHKTSNNGSVHHTGDNLTGEGEGDDETIIVDLKNIPNNVHKLVFVVNIYNCVAKRQHFGMVQNAYIRVVNLSNNQEMIRFNLTDQYTDKTGLIVGEIYRNGNEWKFGALGEGTDDTSLETLSRRYK